ncbi:MAG: dethiobiotin synthase [Panacagrimonas sp.]
MSATLLPAVVWPQTIFVTGTDTGVGKTHVSCGLLRAARARGISACGYKPVASGCRQTASGPASADARQLQKAAGTDLPLARINPYALSRAIAPHLAAREQGIRIERRRLEAAHRWLAARYELVVVEGAGGWQVPLDARSTMADWVIAREWPVILVVGMRLGCLNHALLAAESISRRTRLLGWIADVLPPTQPALSANIKDLRRRMSAPLLGMVSPFERSLDAALLAMLKQLD